MSDITIFGRSLTQFEPPAEGPATLADPIDLSSIIRALRRRFWPVALVVIVAVLLAAAAIALLPRSYHAQTKILVRVGREQVAPLEQAGTRFNNYILTQRTENTNDEIEILRQPQLLDAAFPKLNALLEARRTAAPVRSGPLEAASAWLLQACDPMQTACAWLGKAQDPLQAAGAWLEQAWGSLHAGLIEAKLANRESAAQRLRQRFAAAIDVSGVRETNIIVIGFTWNDPIFAAEALNALMETYEHEHVRLQSDVSGLADLYRKQAVRTEATLAEATAALNRFAAESGSSDPVAERQVVIVRLQELGRELDDGSIEQQQTLRQMEDFRAQFAQTTNWLETPAISQTAVPGLADIDAKHVDLVVARDRLLTQFQPQARQVKDMAAQLSGLRQNKFDALINFLEARRLAAKGRTNRATDEIARMRARLDTLTELQNRITELQERRGQIMAQLTTYRNQAEYLDLQQALNDKGLASVTVLGAATPPELPAGPKRGLIMALAAALSGLLGLGYVAVAELHDTKLRTDRQVRLCMDVRYVTVLPRSRRS